MSYVKEERVPTIEEVVKKVGMSPGLCTEDELAQAERFYNELYEMLTTFRNVWNSDPLGFTCLSKLDDIEKMRKLKNTNINIVYKKR